MIMPTLALILSCLLFTGTVVGLLLNWASSRGWRVPVLWRWLVWDVDYFHVLTKPDPRLELALKDVQARLTTQGLLPPPVQAVILNTLGYEPADVMFGLIFGRRMTGKVSRPTLMFMPAFRLRECDNADLRIAVAHEYGHLLQLRHPTHPLVARICRLEGEDFCHGLAATLYSVDQTMATLKKLGIDGLCQPPVK